VGAFGDWERGGRERWHAGTLVWNIDDDRYDVDDDEYELRKTKVVQRGERMLEVPMYGCTSMYQAYYPKTPI
jgi:hypothetical protein